MFLLITYKMKIEKKNQKKYIIKKLLKHFMIMGYLFMNANDVSPL